MASLFNNFWKGAKGLKVKELAPYTAQYSKDHLTYSKLRPQFKEGLDKYTDKYIDQGSIAPLVHVMWGVFFLSYAISWPGEYRHYKAEQEAKLKGESGHH